MSVTSDALASNARTNENTNFATIMERNLRTLGVSNGDIIALRPLYTDILDLDDLQTLQDASAASEDAVRERVENAVAATEHNKAQSEELSLYGQPVQDSVISRKVPNILPLTSGAAAALMSAPSASTGRTSSFSDNYPDTYGEVDSAGNWYKVDKISGMITFAHFSGTSVTIDKLGKVTLNVVDDYEQAVEGLTVMQSTGTYSIDTLASYLLSALSNVGIQGSPVAISAPDLISASAPAVTLG